jgi:uncharacterized protein (TIGR03382 family)
VLGALTLAAPAVAELPNYTYQLQARTNLTGNPGGAYNVDPGNLLPASLQVPITQDRQTAFRLAITPEGRRGVWWGRSGQGSRIYLLPELGEDVLLGDPSLNSGANLAFAVTNANPASGNGLYLMKATAPSQVTVVREPLGATDWGSLVLNESGQLGFRVIISSFRAYVLLTPKSTGGYDTMYLAKEKSLDGSSPYEFLYSPTLNDRGQMAGVGDTAPAATERFQELRLFNSNGTSTRIAQSRGRSPSSPIFQFASVAPALNNNGQVAFLGTAKSATGTNLTTLWLWNGTALRVLAQDGQGDIGSLEFFPPDMNDSGLVVFRAFDSEGLRAVWVTDGQQLKRVVGEHQILPSDLGEARVDQETANNPVFAGAPTINSRGDVSFVAGLAPPDNDQVEWGTAIYIARASLPPSPPDAGVDGGSGGLPDAGMDAGSGGGVDAGSGGLMDAGWDAGSGSPPDASVDAGLGTPPDAGTEADAGTEEPDAGMEVPDGGPGDFPDAGSTPPPVDVPDSGCDCQAAPAMVLSPWLLLGLARYVAARRRRDSARG